MSDFMFGLCCLRKVPFMEHYRIAFTCIKDIFMCIYIEYIENDIAFLLCPVQLFEMLSIADAAGQCILSKRKTS